MAFTTFKKRMSDKGLKWTKQREIIAEVFFEEKGHLRVDDLLRKARIIDPTVSQATVYRTIKILKEFGLAEELRFDEGQARYEPVADQSDHHDHLICCQCQKIVEFMQQSIENMQRAVAQEHGFTVTHHKLELYGICAECRRKGQ